MAYDATKYQLTKLLQDAWYRMGQLKTFKVTGGSTTTVINTAWAGVEDVIYEDDDPALIYGTAIVARDAGGLNAAPEGEFGQITDYDAASTTATIDTLTAGVAVGDEVGIASPLFPLEDMKKLANIALRRLGEIDLINTSLSVVANQTEYTLPSAIQKKPLRVRVQTVQASGNNFWRDVPNWSVIPATAGSNWTLVVPNLTPNYTLQILYRDKHPELTAFDSPIMANINPELAVSALLAEAMQWYNDQIGGTNSYFLQRENKFLQDLEAAKITYPISKFVEQVQGLPHWKSRGEYVPLTSDLKE